MKRLTIAFAFMVLLALTTPGSAEQAPVQEPDFQHPIAVQAWKRLQFRQQRALQAYERELATARQAYIEGLKEAVHSAARMGNLDEVKLIAEAQTAIASAPAAANPPAMEGASWVQLQRGGRYWKVDFEADGRALVAGGDPVRQSWQINGGVIRLGDDQYVWNGQVFIGVGDAVRRSLVPWPWED